MSEPNARRGRPKGSGLDDRKQLMNIAALIAADPNLKPTTAIRAIGVTDPSVIRRLRDKYNSMLERQQALTEAEVATRAARSSEPHVHPLSQQAARHGAGPATLATAMPREPVLREVPRLEVIAGADAGIAPRRWEPLPPAADWFAAWCGFGLSAAAGAFETQVALMQQMLRLPPVAMVLSSQITINDLAMAMVPCPRILRPTLH
jgi:hypothetical protein